MVVVQSTQIPERFAQKFVPKLSNNRRNQIHEYYLSLTKDNQNIWISHMAETIMPVRLRKKNTGKKERRFTRIHNLENDKGQKVRICQKMFLSTIVVVKKCVVKKWGFRDK